MLFVTGIVDIVITQANVDGQIVANLPLVLTIDTIHPTSGFPIVRVDPTSAFGHTQQEGRQLIAAGRAVGGLKGRESNPGIASCGPAKVVGVNVTSNVEGMPPEGPFKICLVFPNSRETSCCLTGFAASDIRSKA